MNTKQRECWIGTAVIDRQQGRIEHQVSDGPAGKRTTSADFLSAREAVRYARAHFDVINYESDYRPELTGTRWSDA